MSFAEEEWKEFTWGDLHIHLCLPRPDAVMEGYQQRKQLEPAVPFPYWAQVWPAALALCRFLVDYPSYVREKQVVELAGGLGLPSLVAAHRAQRVLCSDYLPEAVAYQQRSIAANGFRNMDAQVLDWRFLPASLGARVLLLSDVNYDAAAFAVLEGAIKRFLRGGAVVILSTPQRLMAKPFVQNLMLWVTHQEEVWVEGQPVSVYVLAEACDK